MIGLLGWGMFGLIISLLLMKFVLVNAYIPSESMENTLNVKDRVIASRIDYYFNDPRRQDVVIFMTDQLADNVIYATKRVIGLPGDKIDIINGNVYVNGKYLVEDYALKDDYTGSFTIPNNCYFMLGDNRENSFDSRFWKDPFVQREDIIGKVCFKFYPKLQKIN